MALLKATASIITISAALTDAAAGSATDGATAPMAAPVAKPRTDRRSKSFWFDSLTGLVMKRLHWMETGVPGRFWGQVRFDGETERTGLQAVSSAGARRRRLRQPFLIIFRPLS